jgi:hypothetical protein
MAGKETMMNLKSIRYSDLNAKQKENYNCQKVSAVLADYGFVTLRLTDDWKSADRIPSNTKMGLSAQAPSSSWRK